MMTHTDESYSKLEAEEMIGRRFITRVSYNQSLPAGTSGTVVEVYPRGDGGYGVMVEWERRPNGYPQRDGFSREEVNEWLVSDPLTTTQQRLATYAQYAYALQNIRDAIDTDATTGYLKDLVAYALITDDCPVCTHPWGYCICKA